MDSITRLPRTQLLIGIAIVIVIAELFANAIVAGGDTSASVGGWIGYSLLGIALAIVLVLVVVPALRDGNRPMVVLAFGVAAVVFCVIFRTAIPFALGAAAIAAAGPHDDAPEGLNEAPSTAGVILALLAILGAFVLCVVG